MTMMADVPGLVTGGVDTHADVHVAAVVDHVGRVLGTESFPVTAEGYRRMRGCWGVLGLVAGGGGVGTGC